MNKDKEKEIIDNWLNNNIHWTDDDNGIKWRDVSRKYFDKYPSFESNLRGFFEGIYVIPKDFFKNPFGEEGVLLYSHYENPIITVHDWIEDILDVHFPLLNEDGGQEPWAKDLEAMKTWVNFPCRRRVLINHAYLVFIYSPYKNKNFDKENINHIRKAMQTYAKVAEHPIFQYVLDKYHWDEEGHEAWKHNLQRFINAQDYGGIYDNTSTYAKALEEIKKGCKESHWIWYIFPQMKGLGHSNLSNYYGIKDREEAYAYMENPILSKRLIEATEAVLNNKHTAYEIFGSDTIKFRSCMLLFSTVSDNPVFKQVIQKYHWK